MISCYKNVPSTFSEMNEVWATSLRSERDFSWRSSREQERGPAWEGTRAGQGSGGESYSICNANAGKKAFLVPTQAKCLKGLFYKNCSNLDCMQESPDLLHYASNTKQCFKQCFGDYTNTKQCSKQCFCD